jgi:hypothetical protein
VGSRVSVQQPSNYGYLTYLKKFSEKKLNQSKSSIFIVELRLVASPFERGQLMLPSK